MNFYFKIITNLIIAIVICWFISLLPLNLFYQVIIAFFLVTFISYKLWFHKVSKFFEIEKLKHNYHLEKRFNTLILFASYGEETALLKLFKDLKNTVLPKILKKINKKDIITLNTHLFNDDLVKKLNKILKLDINLYSIEIQPYAPKLLEKKVLKTSIFFINFIKQYKNKNLSDDKNLLKAEEILNKNFYTYTIRRK
jgi:hypothetical protein